MGDMANDFYEDDEPLADVVAAFEAAPKGLTGHLPPGAVLVGTPATYGSRTDGLITPSTVGAKLTTEAPAPVGR